MLYNMLMSAILIVCLYIAEKNLLMSDDPNDIKKAEAKDFAIYIACGLGIVFVVYSIGIKQSIIILVVYTILDLIGRCFKDTKEIDKSLDDVDKDKDNDEIKESVEEESNAKINTI